MSTAPIREPLATGNGLVNSIWALWFQGIATRTNEGVGVSGTFTTTDAKTVTVVNGIITNII